VQVGGKGSEEFTFPWWDHVFNRAAANIEVASDSDEEGEVSLCVGARP
jgi:hypothetical protein